MIKKLIYICMILPAILLANNNIEITLEHNNSSKKPLDIILKVINTSDKNIEIDPDGFPDGDGYIVRDIFTVIEDGEKVPYEGPILHTIEETPKKILKVGESYQGHVDIAEYYRLKTGTHNYEIHYSKNDNNLSISLETEATITYKSSKSLTRAITCNDSQLNDLGINLSHATSYALKAYNYLPTVDQNHALFKKWFGTATAGRYHTVYTNYGKIYNGLKQNVQFNCEPIPRYCEGSIVAYVYRNKPYEINICNYYWQWDSASKASILVHEMSHFSNIMYSIDGDGTVDTYGTPIRTGSEWAKKIAASNPVAAISNSYSYQYYAKELAGSNSENTGDTGNNSNSSPLYFNFNSRSNTEGWQAGNLNDPYAGPYNGAWFFQASYNDPQIYSPKLNINANAIKKITIRMANASNPARFNRLQVFWKGSGEGFSEANSQSIAVHNHGGWVTYTIDLSRNPRWGGNIEQIRIDPILAGDGHWIAIDYIALTK